MGCTLVYPIILSLIRSRTIDFNFFFSVFAGFAGIRLKNTICVDGSLSQGWVWEEREEKGDVLSKLIRKYSIKGMAAGSWSSHGIKMFSLFILNLLLLFLSNLKTLWKGSVCTTLTNQSFHNWLLRLHYLTDWLINQLFFNCLTCYGHVPNYGS